MLSIGELAERCGVTVRALRYYESKGLGLLMRREAGQCAYKYPSVMRLQQIRLLKYAGFTLGQIKSMLGAATIDASRILGQKMASKNLFQMRYGLSFKQRKKVSDAEV